MAKRDIMVILSLAPTYRTRYGKDAYLYHEASEKHKMMAQDDSEHRQFLDATTHLYKRSCPSVRRSVRPSVGPSVGPYVPSYFQTLKIEVFECGKSSNV